jgi:hypothetical protein
MMSPSLMLGFFLQIIVKTTGVLSPEKLAHPLGGHAVFYIFTFQSRQDYSLPKESSRVHKDILKELFFSDNFYVATACLPHPPVSVLTSVSLHYLWTLNHQ